MGLELSCELLHLPFDQLQLILLFIQLLFEVLHHGLAAEGEGSRPLVRHCPHPIQHLLTGHLLDLEASQVDHRLAIP